MVNALVIDSDSDGNVTKLSIEKREIDPSQPQYYTFDQDGKGDLLIIPRKGFRCKSEISLQIGKCFGEQKNITLWNRYADLDDSNDLDTTKLCKRLSYLSGKNRVVNYTSGTDQEFTASISDLLHDIYDELYGEYKVGERHSLESIVDAINETIAERRLVTMQTESDALMASHISMIEDFYYRTLPQNQRGENTEVDMIIASPEGHKKQWKRGVEVKYYGVHGAERGEKSFELFLETMRQTQKQKDQLGFPMVIVVININQDDQEQKMHVMTESARMCGMNIVNIASNNNLKNICFDEMSHNTVININLSVCDEIYQKLKNNSLIHKKIKEICDKDRKIDNFENKTLSQIFNDVHKGNFELNGNRKLSELNNEEVINAKQQLCGALSEFCNTIAMLYLESLRDPKIRITAHNMPLLSKELYKKGDGKKSLEEETAWGARVSTSSAQPQGIIGF